MQCLNEEQLYAVAQWHDYSAQFEDILYHKSKDGIAKITINRPHVRNAFRPQTVKEMIQALSDARYDNAIGCIILTGQGEKAFCAGGDQKIRGDYGGYRDDNGVHHLNILDFQRQIRTCPKPIVAMVAGYAIGGGHVLHMMCDSLLLTMPYLVKRGLRLAHLMVVGERPIWHASLDKKKHAKFGSYAVNMMHGQH